MLVFWPLRNISSSYVHNNIHVYGFSYFTGEIFMLMKYLKIFYFLTVSNIQERKIS